MPEIAHCPPQSRARMVGYQYLTLYHLDMYLIVLNVFKVVCCLLVIITLRLEMKSLKLDSSKEILNLIRLSKGLQTNQSEFIRGKGLNEKFNTINLKRI